MVLREVNGSDEVGERGSDSVIEQSSGLESEAIRQEEIKGLVEGKGDSLAKRIEEKRECKQNTGSLGHVF